MIGPKAYKCHARTAIHGNIYSSNRRIEILANKGRGRQKGFTAQEMSMDHFFNSVHNKKYSCIFLFCSTHRKTPEVRKPTLAIVYKVSFFQ